MARKSEPTKMKLLKGVNMKDPNRVNKNEPKSFDIGDPPKHMKLKTMQNIWYEIIDNVAYGVFQSSDRVALELTVALLYEFRKKPLEFPTMKMNRLQSFLASFGMTPSDRSKIVIEENEDDNPYDGY